MDQKKIGQKKIGQKKRKRPGQSEMSLKERQKNLALAFGYIDYEVAHDAVRQKIDDIIIEACTCKTCPVHGDNVNA